MSNLAKRIIIAVVAIPAVVALSLAGGWFFLVLASVLASLALWELYALFAAKDIAPARAVGLTFGILIIASFAHPTLVTFLSTLAESQGLPLLFPSQHRLLMIVLLLAVVTAMIVELFRNRPRPMMNIASTLFGLMYVAMLFGTLVGLRELFNPFDVPVARYFPDARSLADPQVVAELDAWGGLTVVSVFAAIWLCDTAAYAIGIPFGKHRLFPRVSPGKSWEGAIAGFLAGCAAMIGARQWFLPYLSLFDAVVLGMIVGGMGQIGDLVESLLKRDAAVKDSSAMIPGHGGVLDRFDSLLFVAPLVYLYIDFIVFS